jgi:hypothetical protein
VSARERPVLFSGGMVRAILDGTKTQTRRIVKPQPDSGPNGRMVDLGSAWGLLDGVLSGEWRCPFGQPGDLLYVRETWCKPYSGDTPDAYIYLADGPDFLSAVAREHNWGRKDGTGWRPSIFMPKRIARLWLRVTDVRVERLQKITEADAIREGTRPAANVTTVDCDTPSPRAAFATLWDSINAKRAPWADNPWVWVVTFERDGAVPHNYRKGA